MRELKKLKKKIVYFRCNFYYFNLFIELCFFKAVERVFSMFICLLFSYSLGRFIF